SSEQALVYYKRFLAESQIAEDLRDKAQAYVTTLEAEQKAREVQQRLEAAVSLKEDDRAPVMVTLPPTDRPSPPSAIHPSDLEQVEVRSSNKVWTMRRKLAVGTAAGGVLALAVGTVLGVSANSKRRDARALCPDPQLACADADHANDLSRSGQIRA